MAFHLVGSYKGGLSLGWISHGVVCLRVASYQGGLSWGGLSSGWMQGGLLSRWCVIREVCHQGGLSVIWVASHQDGLL